MEKARPLWKQSALRYWMSPRNRFAEVQVVGAIDPRTGVQVKGKPDPQAESRIVGSIPEGITIFRSIILVVMRIWWESMMAPFKQRWRDFLLLCNTVHVLLDDCTKQPSWELRHLLSPWCFFDFKFQWRFAGLQSLCRDSWSRTRRLRGFWRRSTRDLFCKGCRLLYHCHSRNMDAGWLCSWRGLCACRSSAEVLGKFTPASRMEWNFWIFTSFAGGIWQSHCRCDFGTGWFRSTFAWLWLGTRDWSHRLAGCREAGLGGTCSAFCKVKGGSRWSSYEHTPSGPFRCASSVCLHWCNWDWCRRNDHSGSLNGCRSSSIVETGGGSQDWCLRCIGG